MEPKNRGLAFEWTIFSLHINLHANYLIAGSIFIFTSKEKILDFLFAQFWLYFDLTYFGLVWHFDVRVL